MKKLHTLLSLPLAFATLGLGGGVAHADLVTYFNFNDAAPLTSDNPGTGPAANQQSIISTTGFTSDFTTAGSLVNALGGDGAGQSLRNAGGSGANGSTFQFTVNLGNFFDPTVSFATLRSGTGFTGNSFRYSTDGTNFFTATNTNGQTTFDPPSGSAFAVQTFDLSSINALDGAQAVTFQVLFGTASGTGGTARFDNIQVNAMATPEPETWAMMIMGVGALAMFAWKRKRSEGEPVYASGMAI